MDENRIRSTLARRAAAVDDVGAGGAGWEKLEPRLRQKRRRSRVTAAVVIIGTCALIALSLTGLWQAVRPENPVPLGIPPGASTAQDSILEVVAKINVGAEPRSIALGPDALWISVNAAPERLILRLDPANGEILARISVPDAPTNLAATDDVLWATMYDPEGAVLLQIDPESNQVGRTLPGVGGSLVADETGVWTLGPGSTEGSSTLVHVAADSLAVDTEVSVTGAIWDIKSGEGDLWVLVAIPGGGTNDAEVLRIDPMTGAIVTSIPVHATWPRLAVGAGYVWVGGSDRSPGSAEVDTDVLRIDVATNSIVATPTSVGVFRPIAVSDGVVWFQGGPDEPRGLCRLNVESIAVEACVDAGPPAVFAIDPIVAIDSATDTLWASNFADTVTQVSYG